MIVFDDISNLKLHILETLLRDPSPEGKRLQPPFGVVITVHACPLKVCLTFNKISLSSAADEDETCCAKYAGFVFLSRKACETNIF